MACQHEHQRDEHAELRLDGEEAEADAGQDRAPLEPGEAGDHQRRGQKAVLPGEDVDPHGRRDHQHEQALGPSPPVARRREVERHAERAPQEIGRHVGQEGERPRHQQQMRRVGPVVMRKVGVEPGCQRRVVGVEIEPRRRPASEGAVRAHPGVHEIAADQIAEAVVGRRRGQEIAGLEHHREHGRGDGDLLIDVVGGRRCGRGQAHAARLARPQ